MGDLYYFDIDAILKEKGLNKSKLAKLIGIKSQYIKRLLTCPTEQAFERLSKSLDIPKETLLAMYHKQQSNILDAIENKARQNLHEELLVNFDDLTDNNETNDNVTTQIVQCAKVSLTCPCCGEKIQITLSTTKK